MKYYREKVSEPLIYSVDSILAEFKKLNVAIDTFSVNGEDEGYFAGWLKSVKAQNGKVIDYKNNDVYLIAYYPNDHFLYLEGGHAADEGVDVLTGKDVLLVGNSASQIISPNKVFRISSVWSGQECSVFVLQKKSKNGWERISLIDNEDTICNFSDYFWTDDNTLYMKIIYSPDTYFKLQIVAKN